MQIGAIAPLDASKVAELQLSRCELTRRCPCKIQIRIDCQKRKMANKRIGLLRLTMRLVLGFGLARRIPIPFSHLNISEDLG